MIKTVHFLSKTDENVQVFKSEYGQNREAQFVPYRLRVKLIHVMYYYGKF